MMQILSHLGKDIAGFPEKANVDKMMEQLTKDEIAPKEVNVELRNLQQLIMKRKM